MQDSSVKKAQATFSLSSMDAMDIELFTFSGGLMRLYVFFFGSEGDSVNIQWKVMAQCGHALVRVQDCQVGTVALIVVLHAGSPT